MVWRIRLLRGLPRLALSRAERGAAPLGPAAQFTPEYFGKDENRKEGDYSRSSSGATPQSFFLGAQPL